MADNLNLYRKIKVSDGVAPEDAINLHQLDDAISKLSFKEAVDKVITDNFDLEVLVGHPTISGTIIESNDRVLVTNHHNAILNGIWQAPANNISPWVRPDDFAHGSSIKKCLILGPDGKLWTNKTKDIIVGVAGINGSTIYETISNGNGTDLSGLGNLKFVFHTLSTTQSSPSPNIWTTEPITQVDSVLVFLNGQKQSTNDFYASYSSNLGAYEIIFDPSDPLMQSVNSKLKVDVAAIVTVVGDPNLISIESNTSFATSGEFYAWDKTFKSPSAIGYATQSYVDNAIANTVFQGVTGVATTNYVDLSISNAFGSLASMTYVNSTVNTLINSISTTYALKSYVASSISAYALKSYVDSAISSISALPALTSYATVSYVNGAISGISSVPSLSAYTLKTYVDNLVTTAISGFASQSYVLSIVSSISGATSVGSSLTKLNYDIGDGINNVYSINHNLNTRHIITNIYENIYPYTKVEATITYPTLSSMSVTFGLIPSSGQYNITLIG